MYTAIGLIIPFAGTSLGAAMVFLMRNKMNPHVEKLLLGFASGVMVAASVWSLLIPSIEMSGDSSLPVWLPPAIGFLLGIGFLLLLDTVTPHIHLNSDKPEGPRTHLKKRTMLVFAVTLHNIPEGMAVGVTFAFLQVQIVSAVSFIGVITFIFSAVGVKIGSLFGTKYKTKAELFGGIVLVLIGIKILLEGIGVLG